MRKLIFSLFVICIFWTSSYAKTGFKVEIQVDHYPKDTVLIGYYLGDKQLVKDTLIGKKGKFVWTSENDFDPGVYMVVLLPQMNVFQFILDDNNRNFELFGDANDLTNSLKVKNSKENSVFFDYIQFISQNRPAADSLRKLMSSTQDQNQKKQWEDQVKGIDQKVENFQNEIIKNNPASFTAKLINASKDHKQPNYDQIPEAGRIPAYVKYKAEYFDDFDFNDKRLLHSPIYFQKINNYISNLTVQHPDSINQSLDFILNKVMPIPEAFRFYLSHYLNNYVKSKYVGMDAVYVHLIDEYYSKGKVDWVEEDNLRKMKDAANDVRPTLIGKVAPNLKLNRIDSVEFYLHDVKSPYLVLFFWAPDCGHCEKAIPFINTFYEKYKSQGVEVLAMCTGLLDEAKNCWKQVHEKHMEHFVNANDPILRSNFKVLYDIKSTPKIFILDKDKKILSKNIGAEQLDEVMGKIISMQKNTKK